MLRSQTDSLSIISVFNTILVGSDTLFSTFSKSIVAEILPISNTGCLIHVTEGLIISFSGKSSYPTIERVSGTEMFNCLEALINCLVILLFVAIIAVVILFTFIFRMVGIIGPSMKETLHQDDRIIISNFMYTPQKGDIVVISRNYTNEANDGVYQSSEPIIKRVIATENQVVDIDFDAGIVYVDDVALDEPYTRTLTTDQYDITFPIRVSEGHIFVLGDNRAESLDSRSSQIGLVDERYVLGKALFRVYPFDQFGGLY